MENKNQFASGNEFQIITNVNLYLEDSTILESSLKVHNYGVSFFDRFSKFTALRNLYSSRIAIVSGDFSRWKNFSFSKREWLLMGTVNG